MKSLDLHGVRHIDVENTVKRFLEDNFDAEEMEIITGCSSKMQSLVKSVLWDYDFNFKTFSGAIKITQ